MATVMTPQVTNLLQRAKAVIERNAPIKKAAFTSGTDLTTGGGLLAPQQAKKFILLLRSKPGLLPIVRMVAMRGPTERIDRITLASRILHTATEGANLSSSLQSVPTTSKLELTAKLFKAEIQLTYESLQDSIEGGQQVRGNSFEGLVFNLIASKLAEDIEDLALLSDTSNAALHADYQVFDGWLKEARDQNTYNANGSAISKSIFKQAFLSLPKPYRTKKRQLRYILSSSAGVEWADEQADRSTSTADQVAWGDKQPDRAYGIPFAYSDFMPEESGNSSNLGQILLTHPKNMVLGIWRNIFLEVDRDIRAGALIVVASIRLDTAFEQVEGAVVANSVKIA